MDVTLDCPGFADSRHAALAYDAAGSRLATSLSDGTPRLVLHIPSPRFPLRIVVTGARCSLATTIERPTEQVGVVLPDGTLLTGTDASALNPSVPCVDTMAPWLADRAPDVLLERVWARCVEDAPLQARIDATFAELPASLLAWAPLYQTHEETRLERLFTMVRANPDHPAAAMLKARLDPTSSQRPWRAIIDLCVCPDPAPTIDIAGAVLLRGMDPAAIERPEAPGAVICACDGRILWER